MARNANTTEIDLEHLALPLDKFTWDAAKGTLVAEASDFGRSAVRFHRIYSDAADLGIAIKSNHTGKVQRFAVASTDMSGDDIGGWWLTPVDPKSRVRRVLIIND